MNEMTKAQHKGSGYSFYLHLAIIVALSWGDYWPTNLFLMVLVMLGILISGGLLGRMLIAYFTQRDESLREPYANHDLLEDIFNKIHEYYQLESRALFFSPIIGILLNLGIGLATGAGWPIHVILILASVFCMRARYCLGQSNETP